jgi:hypothetical protein
VAVKQEVGDGLAVWWAEKGKAGCGVGEPEERLGVVQRTWRTELRPKVQGRFSYFLNT